MVSLPHWPKIPIWQQKKKNNLEAINNLLEALGNPHEKLPPTIHIAGTNGKGSTVAMLRSVFETAQYKVDSYTSPHLLEFNERINLAGNNISDYHLYELLEIVRCKAEELFLELSFFEGVTVAAFLAFANSKADLLILETGMGGRLDCTNVVLKPILTIITPISFDHMIHLGNSLEEIATEKAGIIKEGVPCIISAQEEEVYNILLSKCEELNSPIFCYEYDYIIEEANDGLNYYSQKYSLKLPRPSLLGKHQYINASAVVAAIMLLNNNFKISGHDIAFGLKNAIWRGRIEKIDYQRYSHLGDKNIQIYIDGAHNEAGALALSSWIKDNIETPIYMIVGMTKNRNIENFCRYFQGIVAEGRAVKVLSEPSSHHSEAIATKIDESKICNFKMQASESLETAIREIYNLNNGKNAALIITGSLFLISDVYKLLR